MNHTPQEPKSMQLAVELEYRKEYEAAHELRAQQARIADLEAQLYAISSGGMGASIQPQVQPDTAAQKPVAILDIRRSKRTGELESWGFAEKPNDAKSGTYAVYTAPQQEPVAWRAHPFDYGVGYKGAFALTMRPDQVEMWKRKGWRVDHLYTAPQPTENLNCKSNQKRLATLWGYVKQGLARKPLTDEQIIEIADKTKTAEPGTDGYILPISFARAIESAHNITGDQQ